MRYITLGQSEIKAAAAPLGAMYLGSKQDRDTSFALLDHYVGLGGDFIDTANIYVKWLGDRWVGGESETVIGEWLKTRGNRDNVVISTKMGIDYQDVPASLAPKNIIEECDKSLKRLGIDTIDLYFAHRDDPNVPIEDVLGTFGKLIERGKVRAIGASNYSTSRLSAALENSRLNSLPRFEVLQQRHTYLPVRLGGDTGTQVVLTDDMIDFCTGSEISVMAYSVGLGGTYNRYPGTELPGEYIMPSNRARMDMLREVAGELGATPQQVVLAWVWANPALMPLVAGSSAAQLDENIAAMDVSLSVGQLARLNTIGE